MVQSRPEENLHLPDVEGAFADLTERQILLFDDEEKMYGWGPKAEEIKTYREWLARF
jgi:hypothetical protein